MPEIARELNVDAILEGTVDQVGENVRIRLRLIDVLPQERNLWAQTYERAMTDVLVMYNEATRAIADEIQITLTPEEDARLTIARQVNPKAYEAYIKGLSYFYRLNPQDFVAALQYFESALEKDPDYALAHTGVARVWIGRMQMGLIPPRVAVPKLKAAAQRALELDDTLAEVHYVSALIKTWTDWDWEGGEASFLKALEINPNYPDALVYYANLLCYLGRTDEALACAERAVELDPLNSLSLGISGNVLMYMRRYDDAIERFQDVLKTSPNDPIGNGGLEQSYHMKGMYEEALAAAKAAVTGLGLAEFAEVYARGYEENGYSGAMSLMGDTLATLSRRTYISPFFISYNYVYAGKKDQALEYLEKAYEIEDPNMPYMIEPCFDILHVDPRFQDLLRKMNLQQEK